MIKARITVTLKKGVLDPQGKAISAAVSTLGFENVTNIHQGKIFDLELSENDRTKANREIEAICKKLLVNIVTEDYVIEIL